MLGSRKARERAELIANRLPREFLRNLRELNIFRKVIDDLAHDSLDRPTQFYVNIELLTPHLQESIRKAIAFNNADTTYKLKYREKQIELSKIDPQTAIDNEIYLEVGEALLGNHEQAENVLSRFTSAYHTYDTEKIHPAVMEFVMDAIDKIICGADPMKSFGLKKAKGRPDISNRNKPIIEYETYKKVKKKMESGLITLEVAVEQVAAETELSESTIKRHYLSEKKFHTSHFSKQVK